MGVVEFFKKPEIFSKIPNLYKAFIDGNYYFYNFQRNQSFYLKKVPEKNNRNSQEYTLLFLEWLSSKFNQCADSVILVFDSMDSRKHSMWHCKKYCTYTSLNLETIRNYNFEYKHIQVMICDNDSEQKIIDQCKIHSNNKNKYLLNNEEISDMGIFSGNVNFLWIFPFKKEFLVLNIVQNEENTQYSILNNKILVESNETIVKKNLQKYINEKMAIEISKNTNMIKYFMRMIGATLQNEYIKNPMWDPSIFQEIFNQLQKYARYQYSAICKISVLPFLYFEKFIENIFLKNHFKLVCLMQNAFKFLNFMSSDVFYTFDVSYVKQIAEKDDPTKTINLLYDLLNSVSSKEIKAVEKSFKSVYKEAKKEKILLRTIFSIYLNDQDQTKKEPEMNEKFFFICSCCLYMMVLNLSMMHFNEQSLKDRTVHFYVAKRVWLHVFLSKQMEYQDFYLERYYNFVNEYSKLHGANNSIEDFIFFKYKSLVFSKKF